MCRRGYQIFTCLFVLWGSILQASAQKTKPISHMWLDNWKIDVRAGTGMLLSEVPDKYLDRINQVNIPVHVPGMNGVFSIRKAIHSHFEMGYEWSYYAFSGNVDQENRSFRVQTKAMEHNFLLLYNLRPTYEFRPRFNYFVYYKIGTINLKNEPRLRLADGSSDIVYGTSLTNAYAHNVAVGTGLGFGINHQLSYNLSLLGVVEINRSADEASETYKIQKIFFRSKNTVNNYASLTLGLSYTFNLSEKSKSFFGGPQAETEKRLKQAKMQRKKRQQMRKNNKFRSY